MPDERDRELHGPARPFANAYVVPGTRLIAGEYPGSASPHEAREKLERCLDAGVSLFVDLTHTHELVPYDGLLADLAEEREVRVEYRRMPIRDMDVCEIEHMRTVLAIIDEALENGQTVYVHCWGGVGRTGTTVGCWLVEHDVDGPAALAAVDRLFRTMSPAKRLRHPGGSPQTEAQCAFVESWIPGEDLSPPWSGGRRAMPKSPELPPEAPDA